MAKPFRITSPSDPGVARDPSTGAFISKNPDKMAPPEVVRTSSQRGVQVIDVIPDARASYPGGSVSPSNNPYPPLPKPTLPFRVRQ